MHGEVIVIAGFQISAYYYNQKLDAFSKNKKTQKESSERGKALGYEDKTAIPSFFHHYVVYFFLRLCLEGTKARSGYA